MFKAVTESQDIDTLVSLAREIWTEHYTPIIGAAHVEYMLEHMHSAEVISRQIASENYHYYFLELENEAAGYFGVQLREGELFLSKLYVHSSQRGKGLGRQALHFIQELARSFERDKITLSVNKNNSNSIAAYYKFGFVKTGEHCVDIGHSFVMDDINMELTV